MAPDQREAVVVLCLLGAALAVRLWSAIAYWGWFDELFPETWELSRLVLSQDGSQYALQAGPQTWNAEMHRGWQERAYFRPPLASYYFAGLFRLWDFGRLAVSASQALVACLGYLFIYLTARSLLGLRIAMATLLLLALHPVLIFYDTSFEDGALAFLLIATAIWLLTRRTGPRPAELVGAGFALGAAALTRPNTAIIGVAVAVLVGLANRAQARPRVAALLAPVVLVTGIASLHNLDATGHLSFVADTGGRNLYWGNAATDDQRIDLQGFWDIWEVDHNSPSWLLAQEIRQAAPGQATDGAFFDATLASVSQRPGRTLARILQKAALHFSVFEIPRNRNFAWLREHALPLQLPLIPFFFILVLAAAGFISVAKDSRSWRLLMLTAPWGAALLTEVLFFNASRYRALAIPFLLPLAVRGGLEVWRHAAGRRWRLPGRTAAAAVVLLVLGVVALPPNAEQRYFSSSLFNAAMLLSYADANGTWRITDEEDFEARLKVALELNPHNLDAFAVQQKDRIRRGAKEEAKAAIEARRRQCGEDGLCLETCEQLTRQLGARRQISPRQQRELNPAP